MRIEMDAAVHEYVVRVFGSILYRPQASARFDDENDRLQELAVMCLLEVMVASGAAEHKYNKTRDLDEFNSTDRLIRNWGWVFPGDKLGIDRSERHALEIRGKRSRVFNSKWLAPDKNNVDPSWPN